MNVTTYTNEINASGVNILVKERTVRYNAVNQFTNPKQICELMNSVFRLNKKVEEHLYLMAFRKNTLIGVFLIGKGTVDQCPASPQDILTRALLIGATNIVLLHNHPGGHPTFSIDDLKTTKRIKMACDIVGITLWDHIIVTPRDDNEYVSAKGSNLLDDSK